MLAGYHFYCEVGLFVNFWAVRMRFRDWFEDETVFLNYLVEVFDGFCVGRSLIRNFFSLFVVLRVVWVGWTRSFDLLTSIYFEMEAFLMSRDKWGNSPNKFIKNRNSLIFLSNFYQIIISFIIFLHRLHENTPQSFFTKKMQSRRVSTQTK